MIEPQVRVVGGIPLVELTGSPAGMRGADLAAKVMLRINIATEEGGAKPLSLRTPRSKR